MSNTRYPWWGYVRAVIRLYPERCRQHQEALQQNITPGYTEQVGGHRVNRTVEQTTIRAMTRPEYREYKAVYDAIKTAGSADIIRLITLLFWQKHQRYTIYGAAQKCNVSERTARRWCRKFIMDVGYNLGVVE